MDPADFRRHGHELVEWIADYLEHPDRYPVLSRVKPGDIVAALPAPHLKTASRSTPSWRISSACSCPA